ncbi:phosphatase domain-containing protein [Deinococcus alpinitundrae]|uniref:phosphatase domain-containing protein n=1 Tax=Deinococcus alpinitundrae TaxID=468913 RepID=UPI00137B5D4B|nr:phosphatase domain-containing protein [Deinococcus alpinitundrae]
MNRAAVLGLLLALSSALAVPAHDLSVGGWASVRATHLSIQVDAYDASRHAGPPLLQNIARLLPQVSAGVNVTCRVGTQAVTVQTDQSGHARCDLAATGAVTVNLASGEALTPDIPSLPDAPVVVVSDLDDTVLMTGGPQGRALATFLNATVSNRAAFPDIAPLYHDFAVRGLPIVYLSNSPLGLSEFLRSVLPARGLPSGPLLLRPLDWISLSASKSFKTQSLNALAADLPGQFVLIGDTDQKDPEVYAAFAGAHPGRVKGIAIRDVSGAVRRAEVLRVLANLGVPVVISPDASAFAALVR